MRKLLSFLLISLFICFGVAAKTLEQKKSELKKIYELGGISKVEYDKIIAKILAVSKNRTDTRIYVRGDKSINYGRVLEIMGMLSGSGFTKVALISEPYKER